MDEESVLYYLGMSECLIRFFYIKSDKEGERGRESKTHISPITAIDKLSYAVDPNPCTILPASKTL